MSIKVITGKVRASFVHVFEPQSINGSEPKYSCSLIIPKSDTVTVGKIREAIEQAKQEGVPKWGGKIPSNLKLPLRDGDVDRPEDPAYADSYFINATSQEQPGAVSYTHLDVYKRQDVHLSQSQPAQWDAAADRRLFFYKSDNQPGSMRFSRRELLAHGSA